MSDMSDFVKNTDATAFSIEPFPLFVSGHLPAIHLKISGSLFAACRSVSVGM
jgi:hypothetical protein